VNPHLMYIWCNIYLFIYECAVAFDLRVRIRNVQATVIV
jgi:hypothetical protein